MRIVANLLWSNFYLFYWPSSYLRSCRILTATIFTFQTTFIYRIFFNRIFFQNLFFCLLKFQNFCCSKINEKRKIIYYFCQKPKSDIKNNKRKKSVFISKLFQSLKMMPWYRFSEEKNSWNQLNSSQFTRKRSFVVNK